MPGFRELLNATKAEIREVDTATADEMRAQPGAVVLDVREADEFEQGAIPGALFIPRGTLETSIESRVPDKSTTLIVHCAGRRSRKARTPSRASGCVPVHQKARASSSSAALRSLSPSMCQRSRLVTATDTGAVSRAISAARPRAVASSSASGTTRLTSP